MSHHPPISMAQTFNVELGARIHEGLGTIGKFDGKHPNFVGATASGLVVIHDPNESDIERSVRHHNLNRPMTSLTTTSFDPNFGKTTTSATTTKPASTNSNQEKEGDNDDQHKTVINHEVLLLGSPTSLLVYDAYNNTDVFYREIGDGVNAVASGKVWKTGGSGEPSVVALAGGNGSVQGYNKEGDESWWTVAGDNVGSIAVIPTSSSSSTIAVGSDDYEIRFYQGEMLSGQVTETDRIIRLVPTNKPPKATVNAGGAHQIGYALANGTVGVYGDIIGSQQQSSGAAAQRKWRYKSKNTPTSIAFGDVDLDGVEEMLVGWSNGRFEVRSTGDINRNGECIFKETLSSAVASVSSTDYRNINREMPLVATNGGELLGFVPVEGASDRIIQSSQELEKLTEQKASLEHELQAAERALKEAQELQQQQQAQEKDDQKSAEQIEVRAAVTANPASQRLELIISATGGAVVHSVLARADVVFGANDSVFVMNTDPHTHGGSLAMNIETIKDLPGELHLTVDLQRPMSVVVSSSANNAQFESRTFSIRLPKFAMFAPLDKEEIETCGCANSASDRFPSGVVKAKIAERSSRIATWAQSSFIGFDPKVHNLRAAQSTSKSPYFEAHFKSLRRITKNNNSNNNNNNTIMMNKKPFSPLSPNTSTVVAPPLYVSLLSDADGNLHIRCDDIEVAGEFLQDLANYMSLNELSSAADFPIEFGSCTETIERVNDLNEARLKLTSEMADSTQLVKSLLVKLEDGRTLSDFTGMKKSLDNLYEVNQELMGEHLKRSTNHTDLLSSIKRINNSIQLASRLRVGEAKNKVVTLCRTAVKEEKMSEIVPIFEKGSS